MGQIGNKLIVEIASADVADALDRLYCCHLVTSCWALGTGVRLEGQALFLLSDELAEVAEENLTAAKQLAGRVGELGGVVTIDPSAFVARSPAATLTAPDTAREVGRSCGTPLSTCGSRWAPIKSYSTGPAAGTTSPITCSSSLPGSSPPGGPTSREPSPDR